MEESKALGIHRIYKILSYYKHIDPEDTDKSENLSTQKLVEIIACLANSDLQVKSRFPHLSNKNFNNNFCSVTAADKNDM